MRFSLLMGCVLVSAVSGCRCSTGGTGTNTPEIVADPTGLSFEACPTLDENMTAVKDVFPDERKLNLINNGKAAAVFKFEITGADKAAFTLPSPPADLGSNATVELPVRFAPSRKGESKATLTVDDGDPSTALLSVALTGSGINLPSQPTLKTEVALENDRPADAGAAPMQRACVEGVLCVQSFPSTLYGESVVRTLTLTNLGCPALKITGLEVAPFTAGAGNLAFFLEEPALPPTAASPTTLTTANGAASLNIRIRFRPEDDGSGDTQRFAELKVKTNDPNNPEFSIQLDGEAIVPQIYTSPSSCDYAAATDTCGSATKVANKATFKVKNGGNASLTIDGASFENGGRNGRFAITVNPTGQTIAPGGEATLEVTHTDQPLYVQDVVVVSAKLAGGADGSAGRARAGLSGGTKPCLTTDPMDQVSFSNPTTDVSTTTVKIKNGAGCGELAIDAVEVDTNPFFTLVDPRVAPGTKVAAGAEATATVQFRKPLSGGTQVGTLRVKTNDSDYGPPPFKVLALYSNSPLDQLPEAILKGCLPTDPTCANGKESSLSVSLSNLGANKTLIMSGKASVDPGNATPPGISAYQFRLVSKPTNAANGALEANGQKQAKSEVVLTLDNMATGLYRITLLVFDDKNQQSPIPAELKVTVNP